jgi:DNA-directed RNA polymerase specialized sigma24 family protein
MDFKQIITKQKFYSEIQKKILPFLIKDIGLRSDLAEDIFLESYEIMYNKILKDEIQGSESSLVSFLRRTCFYQATHALRKERKSDSAKAPSILRVYESIETDKEIKEVKAYRSKTEISIDEILNFISEVNQDDADYKDDKVDEILSLVNIERDPSSELMDKFEAIVKNLPSPCDKLLWGKYWEGFSHQELARQNNYKSANTSKVQTNRCVDRFKKKIEPEVKKLSLNYKFKKK